MNKMLLSIMFLLSTVVIFFGCSKLRKDVKNMDTEGVIFMAVSSQSNDYYEPFFEDILSFHKQFNNKKIAGDRVASLSYKETGYDDIWIRDVAPVATGNLVKFVYTPSYLPEDISDSLNESFINWLTDNHFKVTYSQLILDGGNLIWNKKDTVILTTRVLKDNPELSREKIIAQLKQDLAVDRIVLIPPEEGDILAHADGMIKFIDESTMFISDFLGDEEFRRQVEKVILREMPDAKFITIPSAYTDQDQYDDDIASAKGLYINMLETDNALYIPQFSLPEDEELTEFIKKYSDKPVITLEIESLSTMGGAVNCLTWHCPKEFIPASFK